MKQDIYYHQDIPINTKDYIIGFLFFMYIYFLYYVNKNYSMG